MIFHSVYSKSITFIEYFLHLGTMLEIQTSFKWKCEKHGRRQGGAGGGSCPPLEIRLRCISDGLLRQKGTIYTIVSYFETYVSVCL